MYEFIRDHQLNIMLGLASICAIVGVFVLYTRALPGKRKRSLADLEFSAAILLFSDRLAYMFHGDTSVQGFWLVRISNFLVFFMTISVVHAFNLYITDLCRNEIGLEKIPIRLKIVEVISGIGWFMVILSQFTGLYYTFDESNAYQRGPGFIICYIIPFLALFIQLSVLIQYVKRLSIFISIPTFLFTVIPMIASIFQAFFYGVSLTNIALVGMGIVLYFFVIRELNDKLDASQKAALEDVQKVSDSVVRSFEQMVEAVSKAVDSRDRYTRNHSLRVAEYSKEIAQGLGMDEKGCFEVYYSALMHDIGKIKLPGSVVGKAGHLTDDERNIMRKHPQIGADILSEVEELPFLKIAAQYHHERYDGYGYPSGLSGDEIPIIARIVSVANAYDEMTSFKYDREPMAQGKVRELLISEAGRKYDPEIIKIMIDMIDHDTTYVMRELSEENIDEQDRNDLRKVNRMHFDEYKDQVSDGIRISKEYLKIRFETRPDPDHERATSIPALILFDSFDRCVHRSERSIKNLHYYEFGEIWMDGHTVCTSARDIQTDIRTKDSMISIEENEWIPYEIEIVNIKDHVKLKINSPYMYADVTMALPDTTRYVFMGITGEHCSIKNTSVTEISLEVDENSISRIAPEISYFTRKDGDIPNVEIDGYRENASAGIPVEDDMRIMFRAQSLPVADLVQHCAYILLYSSDDGTVNGKNYTEYVCIRLDGEDATQDGKSENKIVVRVDDDFAGWDAWKKVMRRGLDYEVVFRRKRNRIMFRTENAGISIECQSIIPKGTDNVYVAFTGNLCVLMDIKVRL